jgi:hypothetical protein
MYSIAGDLTLHVFVGGGWRPVFYVDKVFFKPLKGRWAVFDVDSHRLIRDGFKTIAIAKVFAVTKVQA